MEPGYFLALDPFMLLTFFKKSASCNEILYFIYSSLNESFSRLWGNIVVGLGCGCSSKCDKLLIEFKLPSIGLVVVKG